MKNVMKKVAVSSMLAVSLGAVSLLSPLATGQVMAKSGSDYIKDQAEEQLIIKQQEAAQKAIEAKLFGTETTATTVKTITVNVQEGDTLASIAEKYGVTVEELVKINNLVKVGQELQVPQTNTNK